MVKVGDGGGESMYETLPTLYGSMNIIYYTKKGESPETSVNERGNAENGIENEVCRKVT